MASGVGLLRGMCNPGRSFAREITRAIQRSKGTSFLIGSAGVCSIETLIRSQVDLKRRWALPVDRVTLIKSKLRWDGMQIEP
jgi:hypothetical protein